jgi:hypothetical protein
MPLIGRVIVSPVPLPRFRALEEFAVLRAFVRFFAEWSLSYSASKMIDDLVLENPDEPRSFRPASFKLFVSLQCREKSLLHRVLGGSIVAESKSRILEKVITVVVEPTTRIGSFIGELILWRVHTNMNFFGPVD